MDRRDFEILELFKRYSEWIKSNDFKDNIENYKFYFKYIEKVEFTYS